jgi:diguanylate cyclase (GGDEF)-like protein
MKLRERRGEFVDLIVDRREVHRALVLLRWLLFICLPIVILLSDKQPTLFVWTCVGLFGLFNIYLSIYVYYRPNIQYVVWIWAFAWLLDLSLITFALTQRDGIHSDLYNVFYLIIVQAGLLYAIRGALFTSIFSSFLYTVTIYLIDQDMVDTKRALIRSIFFIIMSVIVGYLAKLERDAVENSLTDYKTKLPNYKYFHERFCEELKKAKSSGTSLAVSIFDIDNFKSINTRFGHLAGDQILTDLAQLLSLMKQKDDVMARYGGEEFILLMPDTTEKEAMIRLEHIRQVIENFSFKVSDIHYIRLTVSMGATCYRYPYKVSELEILDQADKALADAKNLGKNRVEIWTTSGQISLPL